MWCQHCGQDVPAIAALAGAQPECSRCGRAASSSGKDSNPTAAVSAAKSEAELPEEWTAERRMKHIGRSLRTPLSVAQSVHGDGSLHWIDTLALPTGGASPGSQADNRSQVHRVAHKAQALRHARARRASDRRTQIVAWFGLVLGLGLATGGIVLMGMGMFGEQAIFWQWGVGVTLAGQAILIGGLVHVLTSLWNASRTATRRIHDMQQELAEVGRTAEAIIAQRSGGSSGFYGELTRGASPVVLMANLKGQIDHLATRLHHDV